MANDASRFIQVICTVLGVKTPEQIREEELTKVILSHMKDQEPNLTKIYNKIFEDHRANHLISEELQEFIDEELTV